MVSPERLAANRIRSFVMRAGRMTPAQERGWQAGFPRFGLTLQAGQLDWDQAFGFAGQRVVDFGVHLNPTAMRDAERRPHEDRAFGFVLNPCPGPCKVRC